MNEATADRTHVLVLNSGINLELVEDENLKVPVIVAAPDHERPLVVCGHVEWPITMADDMAQQTWALSIAVPHIAQIMDGDGIDASEAHWLLVQDTFRIGTMNVTWTSPYSWMESAREDTATVKMQWKSFESRSSLWNFLIDQHGTAGLCALLAARPLGRKWSLWKK